MNRLWRVAYALELLVAGLLTLGAIALHFNVMRHAGPLWRDEISSLRLATMPTLAEFWSSLVYDPMPALFFAVLRGWHFLGWGASDENLRYLGFVIGLGVLGAIWVAGWVIKKSPPIWAVLLFGLSPVALVWGDSLRAYGLSCIWNILAIGFFWKLLSERPQVTDIALASAAALLSVHSLFPNSLLLLAAGASAIAIALRRGWRRTAFIIVGIGATAALSLLPYVPIVRRTQDWSALCNDGIDSAWILTMIFRATGAGGNLSATLWIAAAIVVCLAVALAIIKPPFFELSEDENDLLLYAGVTFLIALGGTVCFFRILGWTTSLWYYLPLMGTAALCLDAIAKILCKSITAMIASSLFIVTAAACLAPLVYRATNVRLTNVDLTAAAIKQHARASDLVVVDNFFYAVSFYRYYHGKAPCLSVPGISDLSLHRWDLVKDTMSRPQPIQPVLDRIDQTLRSGHDVYVVGSVPLSRTAAAPPDLPAAPQTTAMWQLRPYIVRWTSQVAYAAQAHARHGMIIPVPCEQPVSNVEDVHAYVVSGWREPALANLQ